MNTVKSTLDRLRAFIEQTMVRDATVSDWSVGTHVHHCLLSMRGISRALMRSEGPPPAKRRPWLATGLLWLGRFPRGRAHAPDPVIPKRAASAVELHALADECEALLAQVVQLDRRAWFEHFEFGILERDKAIRFMSIHNDHHSRIIADILARQR